MLGEEVIILGLDDSMYYGLTGTGARIWELAADAAHRSTRSSTTITAEFDVDRQRAEADLDALLANLQSRGLVAITRSASGRRSGCTATRAVRALVWLIAAGVAVVRPLRDPSRAIARIPASRSPRAAITPAECGIACARVWPVARCLPQAIAGYCLLRRAGLTG